MLLYFSRFGWTQTRTLKFRGRKNTHAQLSQAKTWNPLQRGFTCSQHAIQNLPFCSLQSSFLPKSRSGVWLRDGPCWPEAAVGLCLRLPLTPWSCIALFCTVHWKLCTLSSMENKGLWEVMQSPVEFSVLLIQLVNHSACLILPPLCYLSSASGSRWVSSFVCQAAMLTLAMWIYPLNNMVLRTNALLCPKMWTCLDKRVWLSFHWCGKQHSSHKYCTYHKQGTFRAIKTWLAVKICPAASCIFSFLRQIAVILR